MRFGRKGVIAAAVVIAAIASTGIILTTRHHTSPASALGGPPQKSPSPAPSIAPSTAPSPRPSPSATGSEGNAKKEPGPEIEARSIGGVGTVLVNLRGLTLYHLTTEMNGSIMCTGGCASVWPPLMAPGGKLLPVDPVLARGFGTVMRPDGSRQVTYKGMPLYTYAGDS